MSHVVENYGKVLDEVDYVQTFKALRLRYNQHQDKLKDREKTSLDGYVLYRYSLEMLLNDLF